MPSEANIMLSNSSISSRFPYKSTRVHTINPITDVRPQSGGKSYWIRLSVKGINLPEDLQGGYHTSGGFSVQLNSLSS